jgi:choline transporter-like protein 2/4/5
VIVLSTIFLRKRIDLACQLIKESSKAVACIWSSLFFPVLPWLLHILVIIFAAAVLFSLQTITVPNYQIQEALDSASADSCICPPELNYVNNATCDPNIFKTECKDVNGGACVTKGCYQTSATIPGQVYIYHLINALGFLWISFFVAAVRHMVLATTFATWYWTFNKRNIPSFTVLRSFWLTCRYHVGTLAFGSLIMWICDIVRILLKPIASVQNNGSISVQPAGFLRGCVDFLMSFLQYINRNAYTMCAIHGKGFCRSAKDAFNLIMRNVVRVFVITNITDWLLRIAKYFIVALTVAFTMVYYKNKDPQVVSSLEVPAIMALIGSYLITTVFLSVHKAAVDTVFLCFLEDSERNDGSQDRPYYMSMRLKQLLQK